MSFVTLLSLLIVSLSILLSPTSATYNGIWYWTWSTTTTVGSTNLNIAFNGWTDPQQARTDSSNVFSKLQGEKYISLGGGNANGRWTSTLLSAIQSSCSSKYFSGYQGVSFDIEEGDSGLTTGFKNAFAACKGAGYKVLVTISHSCPYGISDGASLMASVIADRNVDILSPQLYTTGSETSNDYTENGVAWSQYKSFTGAGGIVPSIVTGSLYSSAQTHFSGLGISLNGYIQWSQTASGTPPPPTTTTGSTTTGSTSTTTGSTSTTTGSTASTTRCGATWAIANTGCRVACVDNNGCPAGQFCYANLNPCSAPPPPPTTTTTTTGAAHGGTVRCGTSWTTANSFCGISCASNNNCPGGQFCYADLTYCTAAAVGDGIAEPSSSLSELQVGLIVAGCLLLVAIVAVVVVLTHRKYRAIETV